MAKGSLTYGQIKQAMERIENAKASFEDIPQSYLDRLNAAVELVKQINNVPAPNWDDVSLDDTEAIEKAEHAASERQGLIVAIRQHFTACSYLVKPEEATAKKARKTGGTRQPRRSKEQIEYDLKMAEITKSTKEKLGLAARGRLRPEDQAKLEDAIDREIKKQKLTAPKA